MKEYMIIYKASLRTKILQILISFVISLIVVVTVNLFEDHISVNLINSILVLLLIFGLVFFFEKLEDMLSKKFFLKFGKEALIVCDSKREIHKILNFNEIRRFNLKIDRNKKLFINIATDDLNLSFKLIVIYSINKKKIKHLIKEIDNLIECYKEFSNIVDTDSFLNLKEKFKIS